MGLRALTVLAGEGGGTFLGAVRKDRRFGLQVRTAGQDYCVLARTVFENLLGVVVVDLGFVIEDFRISVLEKLRVVIAQ